MSSNSIQESFAQYKAKFITSLEGMLTNGEVENALLFIREYWKICPNDRDAEIFNLEGVAQFMLGNLDQAELLFTAALIENPDYAESLYNQGIVQEAQNRPCAARFYYSRALYLSDNEPVKADIAAKLQSLPALRDLTSIVIVADNGFPSLRACIDGIRVNLVPGTYELIVVAAPAAADTKEWLLEQADVQLVLSDEAGFARRSRPGVERASGRYVLFLDSTVLVTEQCLPRLIACLESSLEIGAAEPVHDLTRPLLSGEDKRQYLLRLDGRCLLVKTALLHTTGLFSERFASFSAQLADFSLRALGQGFKLVECSDAFVKAALPGSPAESEWGEDHDRFGKKWGFFPLVSLTVADQLVVLIDAEPDRELAVLEVGCGCGATLLSIRNKYPRAAVYGVEPNEAAAKLAASFAQVQIGHPAEAYRHYPSCSFDYIVIDHGIESLDDPWTVLACYRSLLKPTGFLLARLPNVMHFSVIRDILDGNWVPAAVGIVDRPVKSFFTPETVNSLFRQAGFADVTLSGLSAALTPVDEAFVQGLCSIADDHLRDSYLSQHIVVKAGGAEKPQAAKERERTATRDPIIREQGADLGCQVVSKALLIYDLHEDLDRSRQLSVLHGLLVNPVLESGLFGEVAHLHRETLFEVGIDAWTEALLRECATNRPDVMFFHIPFSYQEQVGAALRTIRDEMKIPVVGFATDLITGLDGAYRSLKTVYSAYNTCVSKTISIDTANPALHYPNGDFIIGFPVVNYEQFSPSVCEKDIDVSFTGSVASWARVGNHSRAQYIEYLKPKLGDAGIKALFTDTSGRGFTLAEYAASLNRSKMVINFSQTTAGNRHMKGRVFEILGSGGLLLEEWGPETSRYFTAGEDYVEFSDPEDLFSKICHYQQYHEEQQKIAKAGHEKALTVYNGRNLLTHVLRVLGFKVIQTPEYLGYLNKVQAFLP